MESVYGRPVIRKKTICKSTSSFGFSDVGDLPKHPTHRRSHSHEKSTLNEFKDASPKKIVNVKMCDIQGAPGKDTPSKKILAEQKALWKLKIKAEKELKKNEVDKRRENLRELHEKSKILLKENLKKKAHKDKTDNNQPNIKSEFATHDENKPNTAVISTLVQSKAENVELKPLKHDSKYTEADIETHLIEKNNIEREKDFDLAAIIIQKHYRGHMARKKNVNNTVNTTAPEKDIEQSLPENIEPSQTSTKTNVTVLPDLYIDYPFNIISSVKSKFCSMSDIEINNTKITSNKINNDPCTQIKLHNVTTMIQKKSIPTETDTQSNLVDSKRKTRRSILSDLKQSLEEVQSLTSPFYFKNVPHESDSIGNISTSTKINSPSVPKVAGKEKESSLNAPEINLIWLRHRNKKTVTPQNLHNSFQDELNLLESFNDSLRQVQNIEKSITSIRKEDLSITDIESVECVRDDESTGITFIGSSDMSIINKHPENNTQIHKDIYEKLSTKDVLRNTKSYQVNSKQFMIQKCIDNDKSLILSQKDNVSHNLTNTSDIYSSDNDSVIEKNIESCTSSMIDVSTNHMFDFNDYKNTGVSSKLNKFCLCLVSQYIEDEKVRSDYLNTLLKVREKTLLDATRNELLCLEIQKKHNHSQIPLLKKKQRGLLLKLQQERNEIKHIKKFQQQQSQERKASLRRQLKHLKQMLACDEGLFAARKKQKNTSVLLNTSKNSINSPLKGINIALASEIQNSDGSINQIWEGLEKRRQDLNDQKKKMHDLLHLHFNNIFDSAEIKVIQEKLSKPLNDVHINKNDEKNNQSNTGSPVNNSLLYKSIDKDNSVKVTINKNNLDIDKNNKQCKCFNGNTLNSLWEKITGHRSDRYENNKSYNMTKDSLDLFFNEAKQVAIDNMLSPLQRNMNVEVRKPDPIEEPFTHCLNANKIESTSFINNLLKSEGRELADLISKDKEAQQELLNKSEHFISNEYSGNLSNNESEPSDTSKSTARSLVEELSYLYPSGGNFVESENENKSENLQIQAESKYENSHKQNNYVESEKKEKEKGLSKVYDSDVPKDKVISTSTMAEGKKLLDANNETETSNTIADTNIQSVSVISKAPASDKIIHPDTDQVSIVKEHAFIDSSIDMTNKRFYADDGSISRFIEFKSPISAEYLSGTWESISPSPDPSPRDSPTGEYSPAAAASMSPLCHLNEAEELRRKQLAIELEIKALEQQQTQLPYCLVREIPDKPPPPYIPPSDESKVIVSPIKVIEPKAPPSIPNLIESFCSWLWSKFSSGKSELATYNNYCNVNKFTTNIQDYTFIFDVCFETYQSELSKITVDTTPVLPWGYKKNTGIKKKADKVELCVKVQNKVKELIGIESKPIRENLIISWTQKRQDFVNNLLIKELYKEEEDWLNIEPYEVSLKTNLTNSILDTLIIEMCSELKSLIF